MQDRRLFLKHSIITGLSAVTLAQSGQAVAAPREPASREAAPTREPSVSRLHKIIRPRALSSGDTIGLVAPASNAWENRDIRYAVDIIKSLGFKVVEGKFLYERNAYLAGDDRERAEDLNTMFADRRIDGIFSLRGGYGTPRMLPYVDYDLIRRNPKVLLGYSDISALLNAVTSLTGLITFHGPIAKQSFSDYTLKEFKEVLMKGDTGVVIGEPPPFEGGEGRAEYDNRITTFRGGKAKGRLIGGNMSLMVKLIGTPYEPNFENAILFLEEIKEEPYRIDGMLTHLWLAGRLQKLAGIAFGKFTDCDSLSGNSFSIEEIIAHRCGDLKIPVVRGLMIGHVKDQTTVPLGAFAELDADAGSIKLLESPVRS